MGYVSCFQSIIKENRILHDESARPFLECDSGFINQEDSFYEASHFNGST